MHKPATLAAAFLAASVLLTGCGSEKSAGPDKAGEASPGASIGGGAQGSTSEKKGVAHQVVFEVGGTGTGKVGWVGNTNHFEQVTLPWTKTESMQLEGAELKVGINISVVPASIEGSDGMLKPAPCTIKVDGKEVADNQGGKSNTYCKYKIKD
ncbi:hypothetical protein [Streptomyces sp. NPDC052811]|uniref:hypothetical protein n=1 Tax=Streptomyces sp. NPDC052811 TaxID=3155731 RepID=UPI00341E4D94